MLCSLREPNLCLLRYNNDYSLLYILERPSFNSSGLTSYRAGLSGAGTSVYPASLFSSAPLSKLLTACHQASCALQEGRVPSIGTPHVICHQGAPDSHVYSAHAENSMQSNASLTSYSMTSGTVQNGSSSGIASHLLNLKQFSCGIGHHLAVVTNLDLSMKPGEHLLVVGPSGSGKSTLIRSIAGLWPSIAKTKYVAPQVLIKPMIVCIPALLARRCCMVAAH